MEFIQKKTSDRAIEYFIKKATDQEIALVWDRFESQLPECGFCESGLSCRDCLQGPCISHPFRNESKQGICGKDKDLLAVHSLLRLVIKGTMALMSQLIDFVKAVESAEITTRDKGEAKEIVKDVKRLIENGDAKVVNEFPSSVRDSWKATGISPQGIARDLFKASQKLEGGISDIEELLLWTLKVSVLGCNAQRLHGKLKQAVFGLVDPTTVKVNLGVLQKDVPNILLYGYLSPILKHKIAEKAHEEKMAVLGVCTDPLLPPYCFSPVTTYGSQEIPLMTGAVDLIVAGDQCVNPSLVKMAKNWKVTLVLAERLKDDQDMEALSRQIVVQAEKAFDNRHDIPRDIPEIIESAVMGFSAKHVDIKRIIEGLNAGKIKGIAMLGGSNNVKYSQDDVITGIVQSFLANDILCISEGEASVCLAKYGLLNPREREKYCREGLMEFLVSLGKDIPPVLDWCTTDFLLTIAHIDDKALRNDSIVACFPETNRSEDVSKALWTVAMGISTYFWPCLPVTGSPRTITALTDFCKATFGSQLHVITEKLAPGAKADLFLRSLKEPITMSGKSWEES